MDGFFAICQGIGLALAAGALAGAVGPRGSLATVLLVAGAALGAVAFALSLSAEDYAAWPGIPAGAALAPLGFEVSRSIAIGAAERAASGAEDAGGGRGGIAVTLALVALALAALATLLPPVSLAALAFFGWLLAARRRRADRKYEGLRVLR